MKSQRERKRLKPLTYDLHRVGIRGRHFQAPLAHLVSQLQTEEVSHRLGRCDQRSARVAALLRFPCRHSDSERRRRRLAATETLSPEGLVTLHLKDRPVM